MEINRRRKGGDGEKDRKMGGIGRKGVSNSEKDTQKKMVVREKG